MDSEFWRGKRVLVTGHTGFKGSWLSLWLQKKKANVIGYALSPPSHPSLFETAGVAEGMMSLQGDVRDASSLQNTIAQYKPEIIIHMAAQPLVRYSYQNPVETYTTNVIGTVNVLEAIRQTEGIRVIVNVTSDKCYENREWVWGYRENEAMGGHDPYSSSKGCAELVAAAYRNSYFSPQTYGEHGVGLASVRAGNVIGGGDWARDRLIPDIIRAIMAKETVVIRSPDAIRPWQHVLEPLGGYLTLAEQLWSAGATYAEGWNFGPNDEDARPVSWIVEHLTKLWGNGAQWKLDAKINPHEATYLKLDCSKAKNRLQWSPKLDLGTTLDWIVEWYRSYLNGDDMRQLTERQINQYEAYDEVSSQD